MFAGAASFTDQADIAQTEAVDMLTALGVIQGYDDGSFRPDDTITRAEAAKMIYTIWNGGDDNANAFVGTSNFTDVYSGYWAEGYINFCYANGIIAGIGNNRFAPEDNVTGTELAKMLLICMGYQADRSGLTGAAWVQNTNALATQNGLYVDVASSISSAMPRQYAAQLMYNALKADTVQWSTDSNAYEKVRTTGMTGYLGSDNQWHFTSTYVNETLGQKCMDLATANLPLTSVELENGRDTYSLNGGAFTRVVTDYSDLIGQYVNVLYKDGETDEVYGVYADEDSEVLASGIVGKLEDNSNNRKIDLNGTSYDLDQTAGNTTVYTVNDDVTYVLADLVDDMATDNSYAWNIKLIDIDGDGDANYGYVTKVNLGQVNYVNSSIVRVNVLNGNDGNTVSNVEYDQDDDHIYADIARDDWVVITDSACTVDGNYIVEAADVVTGRVQSTRTNEVRVDGTWYDTIPSVSASVGNTVDMVVYGDMVFDISGASASLDIAVVTGIGNYSRMDSTLEVRLMFRDGSEEVVDVEAWNTNPNLAADVITGENTMVEYSVSDSKYTLTTIDDTALTTNNSYTGVVKGADETASYTERSESVSINGTAYDIDDGATVIIHSRYNTSNDDYIYMTGADLKTRDNITFAGNVYAVIDSDDTIVALFGETTSNVSSAVKSYGYITDIWTQEGTDGDRVYFVDMITDSGEAITDQETDETSGFATGDVVSYTMNGDIMSMDDETADMEVGAVTSVSSGRAVNIRVASTGSTNRYMITDDTVIIAIDGEYDDATYAGDSVVESLTNNGNWVNNAWFKATENDSVWELDLIIVQVDTTEAFGD